MIVCICKVVSDKDISRVIGGGARSVDQVGSRCGAGTGCGECREYISSMIERSCADALSCAGAGSSGCRHGQEAA